MALIPLEEPTTRRVPPDRLALFALGFRPFYLLAAGFAVLAVPAWVLVLAGWLTPPIAGLWWHAHEMLFGFAVAVIVGFLLTAGRNWTGLPTPSGRPLAALAALWLAGRLAMIAGDGVVVAAVDLAFLPVAAIALGRVLVKARSKRNYFLLVMLAALTLANLVFHLARFGFAGGDPLLPLHFALGLVVVIETTIAGRVVPMFTSNALRGIRQWQHPRLNIAAIVGTALGLGLWAAGVEGAWVGGVALLAALLQAVRCAGWNPRAALAKPLLWILHLSHLWIPVGLALLAAAQWGWVPRSAGIHALGIGATAGLIMGMITRTALGHTGRMLESGPVEAAAYVLVQVAAVARVLTLAVIPAAALAGIHLAATAWVLAFVFYLWRYLPMLVRARVDGREG